MNESVQIRVIRGEPLRCAATPTISDQRPLDLRVLDTTHLYRKIYFHR